MSKVTCAMCAHLDEKTQVCEVLTTYVLLNKARPNCVRNNRFVERLAPVSSEEVADQPVAEMPIATPLVAVPELKKAGLFSKVKKFFRV